MVLIIDDDRDLLEEIVEVVEISGHEAKGFSDFRKALAYIEELETPPHMTLVDMKPVKSIIGDFTENDKELLAFPEKIFLLFKERGWQDNFVFITANLSEHDSEVIERHEASYIEKMKLVDWIEGNL